VRAPGARCHYLAVAPRPPRRCRSAGGRADPHGTHAIRDLPQIVHWPNDGGPFITLPQVYTEDVERPA
jgi:UbiD family decarboxylase